MNKEGKVIRHKMRLVVQGYWQQEGISYDKTFASVEKLKSIRILLAFAYFKCFKPISNECKECLRKYFINNIFVTTTRIWKLLLSDYIFIFSKALYHLKQTSKASFTILSTFLQHNNSQTEKIETTLFIQKLDSIILIVQIYVGDIILKS